MLIRLTHEAIAMAFDCEGNFSFTSYPNHYNEGLKLGAVIHQKWCDELLYTIAETLNFGKVLPGSCWHCNGKLNTERFLNVVQPYLIVNREQAKVIRTALATINVNHHPLTPQQVILREKLLTVWELNFSQKAKRERRYGVDKGAVANIQSVPSRQAP